ncbi:MAG: hypothetical protein IBX55_00050 [Methyloprofundus sp.]|nr:hypothetical protein [Methyloprofundus sp.]
MATRYGTVIFDDPTIHKSGWACDGLETFRIESTSSLDSDVNWLTSLDFGAMHASGLATNARFRMSNYLSEYFIKPPSPNSERPYDIINHLGFDKNYGEDHVKAMQKVFENTMCLLESHSEIKNPPPNALSLGIRRQFPADSIISETLFRAVRDSNVEYIVTERNSDIDYSDLIVTTWHKPRINHSRRILSNYFPDLQGEWKHELLSVIGYEESLEHLEKDREEGVCIYRVKLRDFDKRINDITNFGSGRDESRYWITSLELQFLMNYVEHVEIYESFKCTEFQKPSELMEILNDRFTPVHELSISAGLYAQNLWMGMTKQGKPPMHITKGRPTGNTMSPFINALDRILLFEDVMYLSEMGAHIIGYGRGKVRFAASSKLLENKAWMNEVLKKTELLPVSGLFEEDFYEIDPGNPVQVYQGLLLTGSTSKILEIDEKLTKGIRK